MDKVNGAERQRGQPGLRVRKHRHAMEKVNAIGREAGLGRGVSMRPSKIGRSEGTR